MDRIFEKLKNRYSILVFIISSVFIVFFFKLISLTLVQGDEFRELSNNKRLKEIPITSARGEIRDRYGRLLAGNKVSFTVQLIKDELNVKDSEERNKTILRLIHILNSEGTTYNDEFPIVFNSYKFKNQDMNKNSDIEPDERVSDIIVENKLIGELLSTTMKYSNNKSVPRFVTAKKVMNILENDGMEIPININYDENQNIVSFEYERKEKLQKWKEENEIPENMEPDIAIIKLIDDRNAKKVVMKILNDPMVSKLAYDMLQQRNLAQEIEIEPIVLKYDEEYVKIKKDLTDKFETVTMNSKAFDDFINILKEKNKINEILEHTLTQKDKFDSKKEVTINPGEIMLEKFKDNKINMPIKASADKESKIITYKYTGEKEKESLLKKYNLNVNTNALDAMISVADNESTKSESEDSSILEIFIKDDKIKSLAQNTLLKVYPNPKISIAEWEYTPLMEKQAWLNRYQLEDDNDAKINFENLKGKIGLDEKLTDYEARGTMLIIDELNKVGYRGYYPINIAYGINDKTVSRLEENKSDLPGVKVSLEPVRYYPNGETGAHILGYMGKIAQQEEIDKYINEKNYLPSTLIGKTGVEVKFEDYLKGKDGKKTVEADAYGNVVKVVSEEPAKPGDTLYLTIDSKLQKIADESLEKAMTGIRDGGAFKSEWGDFSYGRTYPSAYSGAAVAVDVKTGEVLALSSYPSYDPNLFATGISSEDWKSLNPENDEGGLPLYNIAISSPVQPGSTFKMVTGLAGLESGIRPEKTIYDYGYVQVGNRKFTCLAWSNGGGSHGPTDVYRALEKSCNYYFYSVALGRIPQTGEVLGKDMNIEKVLDTAKKLGLGDKAGIEIPGERILGVPDTNSKSKNSKALLERFLKSRIDYFIKEDEKLTEKEIKSAIEEITSWTDLDLSKGEIINKLSKLGIDGEKKDTNSEKGEDLGDQLRYTYLGETGWTSADSLNTSIGQGENAYTPLQMANYISIISNGGYKHNTNIVDRIQTFDNTKRTYKTKKETTRIEMNDYKNLDEMGKGMARVTKNDGTARRAFEGFPIDVAAKTGTAERSGISPITKREYDNYAWFTAYAPYEENNPDAAQIAVSVVIFQGGSGGNSSPVAREIIAEYLGLNSTDSELNKFDLSTKLAK